MNLFSTNFQPTKRSAGTLMAAGIYFSTIQLFRQNNNAKQWISCNEPVVRKANRINSNQNTFGEPSPALLIFNYLSACYRQPDLPKKLAEIGECTARVNSSSETNCHPNKLI